MSLRRFGWPARLLLFFGVALVAIAQTEPDFPDVFFAVVHGKNVALERQEVSAQVKGSGLVSAKRLIEIPGQSSPVRIARGTVEFIVKMPAPGDPDARYHLRKLEHKKGARLVILGKASAFSGVSTNTESVVLPAYSKIGESSVRVSVNLEPGEYAIGRRGAQTVFCFGVD